MSDPIILRSEAINSAVNSMETRINDVSDTVTNSSEVASLSTVVTDAQISLTTMKNDIVKMKDAISLLQKQIVHLATSTSTELSDVKNTGDDAPTTEDEEEGAIPYSIDLGTFATDKGWKSDSTTVCKHYTYDVLHVILMSTAYTGTEKAWTKAYIAKTDKVDNLLVATFPDLSSYKGHGFLPMVMPGPSHQASANSLDASADDSFRFVDFLIRNNTVQCHRPLSTPLNSASNQVLCSFWFDLSRQSRMFEIENGQLISSVASIASPSFCVHAKLGNLHFLSISTKTTSIIPTGQQTQIASFANNLAVSTGGFMGTGVAVSNDEESNLLFNVMAPSNNAIAVRPRYKAIPVNSYLSIGLVWIDSLAVAGDCDVKLGTTPALSGAGAFAKLFTYKHLNVCQIYGTGSEFSSRVVGRFSEAINTPFYDASIAHPTYMEAVKETNNSTEIKNGSAIQTVKQTSDTAFSNLSVLTNSDGWVVDSPQNVQLLWFA